MPDQPQLDTAIHKHLSERAIAALAGVTVLKSMNPADLACLDITAELELADGQVLARQGETVRKFWIVLEGTLRITIGGQDKSGQPRAEQFVGTIDAGGSFGEISVLANMPFTATFRANGPCFLLELSEEQFWALMTSCPQVRQAILGDMASRLAHMQSNTFRQEKMAALGTLAAGLMHELNNPGTAARRSASQLRANLLRLNVLSERFSKVEMSDEHKKMLFGLKDLALNSKPIVALNSLDQADAEQAISDWLEEAGVEDAWRIGPTLVSIGMDQSKLEKAWHAFPPEIFSDAINWLESLVSSMQLVDIIEESVGRVTDLVHAVKSYAYEGQGQKQQLDVNMSIHATVLILAHKMREKQITLDKTLDKTLPPLELSCGGLNQVWTNLLDNAIDAAPKEGRITIKTWAESFTASDNTQHRDLCVLIGDNGAGIPLECQAHIFDPFFTTKPVGVGTGLGLGIAYRVVEQCGGSLHFSSTPGDTEFIVRLPFDARPAS